VSEPNPAASIAVVTPGAPAGYDPLKHACIRKQLWLIAEGKLNLDPGAMQHIEVRHDDWCALLVRGGYCSCDPDIRVRRGAWQ
jgi:hypothetical protein